MTVIAQADVTTSPILTAILGMSDFILDYAITLAALGALTVALIEAWKKLRDSQAKFHRRSVLRWLENEGHGGATGAAPRHHYRARAADHADRAGLAPYDAGRCFEQLLLLTTGVGDPTGRGAGRYAPAVAMSWTTYQRSIEFALFELELDRLMGQVQDAADIALNHPHRFPDLFQFLTRSAAPDDVDRWLSDVQQPMTIVGADEARRKEISDRFTRLKQLVRRHLDSFQIVTAMRWREWNQLAALIVGATLLATAQVTVVLQAGGSPLASWLKIGAVSLLGGMLAPVAKDLVDALRKVKASV
jgi:hypothetical protein